MDASFTFPPHKPPIPRPSLPSSTSASSSGGADRESDALRASVLDAALELGIGSNSTVTNWMFSNSLTEEDEEELRSPALTYGSTATSEESTFSSRNPLPSSIPQVPSNYRLPQATSVTPDGSHIRFEKPADHVPPPSRPPPAGPAVPFPEIPIPPRPVTPVRGKLKKKRNDGYESDGGYVSDAGKKKERRKGEKEETNSGGPHVESKADKKERAKEAKNRAREDKLQEKREKEEERKRIKSLSKAKKGQTEDKDGYTTGYETDGGKSISKKSKAKADTGYETDSGYISSSTPSKSKSRSRFFKLGSKQSKPELRHEDVPAMPAPVVEREPVPLPIASRFATTLNTSPNSPDTSSLNTIKKSVDTPFVPSLMTSFSSSSTPIPAVHSPTSPTSTLPNPRESLGSSESGGSAVASSTTSHSKRRGLQFFAHDNSGPTNIHNTTRSPPPPVPLPLVQSTRSSPSSPTAKFPAISLPLTRTSSSISSTQGKVDPSSRQPSPSHLGTQKLSPAIPSTSRNPSPTPTPTSVFRNQFLQPTTSSPSSPSPISPTAPLTLSSRVRPLHPPTNGFGPRPTPTPSPRLSTSPSPASPASPSFLRSPSPNLRIQRNSPLSENRPNLTIVPSSDYLVPSPRASLLTSPNVLAYYDIPPPSPPPTGPLPSVPPPGRYTRAGTTATATRTQERPGGGSQSSGSSSFGHGTKVSSEQHVHGHSANHSQTQPSISNIQRGRESPFPSRPILSHAAGTGTGTNTNTNTALPAGGLGPGLEARVKVPRYRELYGLALPQSQAQVQRQQRDLRPPELPSRAWSGHKQDDNDNDDRESKLNIDIVEPSDAGWGNDDGVGYEDDGEDEESMQSILDRFEEARRRKTGAGAGDAYYKVSPPQLDEPRRRHPEGKALGRSRSFEAIQARLGADEFGSDSEYHTHQDDDDDDDMVEVEPEPEPEPEEGESIIIGRKSSTEESFGERTSRWSGSIYSRVSLLDPDQSEETRQRFVKRVEDMLGANGGRTGEVENQKTATPIPPVPKIPDAFVGVVASTPGRTWNRF